MAVQELVGLPEVEAAAARLAGRVHRTPLLSVRSLGRDLGCELSVKAELLQRTGSFKPRGALNRLLQLTDEQRSRGVISLSAGNHAAALAFAAHEVGTTALIVMPTRASAMKVAATRAYGGEVLLTDGDLLAVTHAEQEARGLTLVHPFDDPDVIAGAGTVGLELAAQADRLDVVVVPVGGGGLISGVAATLAALRPDVRVIGVEPEGADGMFRSLAAGEPVSLVPQTIADGLAAPFAGLLTLRHVQAHVAQLRLVTEAAIRAATRLLYARTKLAVEPSAAVGLAAMMDRPADFAGLRVALVLSGGNIAPELLAEIFTDQP